MCISYWKQNIEKLPYVAHGFDRIALPLRCTFSTQICMQIWHLANTRPVFSWYANVLELTIGMWCKCKVIVQPSREGNDGDCRRPELRRRVCRLRQKQTFVSSFRLLHIIDVTPRQEVKCSYSDLHCWYQSTERVHRAWFGLGAQCSRAEGYIATHNNLPTFMTVKEVKTNVDNEIGTMSTHRVVPRGGNHHSCVGLFWSIHRDGGNFLWWVGKGNILLLRAFLGKTGHGLRVIDAENEQWKLSKVRTVVRC